MAPSRLCCWVSNSACEAKNKYQERKRRRNHFPKCKSRCLEGYFDISPIMTKAIRGYWFLSCLSVDVALFTAVRLSSNSASEMNNEYSGSKKKERRDRPPRPAWMPSSRMIMIFWLSAHSDEKKINFVFRFLGLRTPRGRKRAVTVALVWCYVTCKLLARHFRHYETNTTNKQPKYSINMQKINTILMQQAMTNGVNAPTKALVAWECIVVFAFCAVAERVRCSRTSTSTNASWNIEISQAETLRYKNKEPITT